MNKEFMAWLTENEPSGPTSDLESLNSALLDVLLVVDEMKTSTSPEGVELLGEVRGHLEKAITLTSSGSSSEEPLVPADGGQSFAESIRKAPKTTHFRESIGGGGFIRRVPKC